jgi:hypothetical protein
MLKKPKRASAGNPSNAVGGLFIRGLQGKNAASMLLNPTNAVGGLFIPSLTLRFTFRLMRATPDMNDPPTALVGFGIPWPVSRVG